MSSLKRNYIFDILNTVSSLFFPMITFPYVSRILGPEGLGLVGFMGSIVNYIVLIVSLGIPMYATREVAKVRNDKAKLSKLTKEIFCLHSLLAIGGYILVLIILFTVPQVFAHKWIFLLSSLNIGVNVLGVSWFYSGTEQFRYITLRGLVVRCISLPALFIFVKTASDIIPYMLVNLCAEMGNYFVNFYRLRKCINWKQWSLVDLDIKQHLPHIWILFISSVAITIYFNLDNIMIGFISGENAVGYYAPALKLQRILMGIVISVGTVVFPRLSYLSKCNSKEEYDKLAAKAIKVAMSIGLPLCVGLICLAGPLIELFAGVRYMPSILTLQLLAPVVFFGTLSNVIAKILVSSGNEKSMTKATIVGAIVNASLNALLIYWFSHRGAACASSIAEFSVIISMLIFGRKVIPLKLVGKECLVYPISALVMGIVIISLPISNLMLNVLFGFILGVIVYLVGLIIAREKLLLPSIINVFFKFRV